MMQMIQEYKPLILDANYPDFEESERVLDQLDRRGLCYNARFDPQTFASLPSDVPGGQKWLLQPEVDRAR